MSKGIDPQVYELAETLVDGLDIRSSEDRARWVKRMSNALQMAFEDVTEEFDSENQVTAAK